MTKSTTLDPAAPERRRRLVLGVLTGGGGWGKMALLSRRAGWVLFDTYIRVINPDALKAVGVPAARKRGRQCEFFCSAYS